MTTLALIIILLAVVSITGIIMYLNKIRRFNQLNDKINFAMRSEQLMKVEMAGNDLAAAIATNFNTMSEKISWYKSSNTELSTIKEEKQSLDTKLKTFESSLSQLNLLTTIGKQITACLNENDIALKLFKNINSSMIADEVTILIERGKEKHYYNVNNGKLGGISNTVWRDDKDNLLNWCYDNNKEVYLNNASLDYGQFVFKPMKMQNGIVAESVIALPLTISSRMIGSVSVLSNAKNSFNNFHLDFTRSLASYVSVAIDNANLYQELDSEKQKSDELLLNILPSDIASELKQKGSSDARFFEHVTVMFTDFVAFTKISERLSPTQLVAEIDYFFRAFDEIVTNHGIEKIKTIGDSYMCAGGLPVVNLTHTYDVVNAALKIQEFMHKHAIQSIKEGKEPFQIRIGIHTGPVVAGIVGTKKFAYDIWGDTVNIASRMESSSEARKINISGSTYELVKDKFNFTPRGKINAKNKGEIDMYFVEREVELN